MPPSDNTFGRPAADRRTIQRSNDEWIASQRAATNTRFVIVTSQLSLCDETPALVRLKASQLPADWQNWQQVFLGVVDDTPLFALAPPDDAHSLLHGHGRFEELRPLAMRLPEADAALIAHARAVAHWHTMQRYCGGCGSELECAAGGHARRCRNPACGIGEIFPRIDPAVIVLVTHGERCLLGRQRNWPPGRWSCLAGFAEAGETLEETVRREVHEEAGVRIDKVRYHSSQPWPFPQSLMIGFMASATSSEIVLHDDELEDARWFSRDEIRAHVAAGEMKLSARLSIAWRLLHDWYAQAADPAELYAAE